MTYILILSLLLLLCWLILGQRYFIYALACIPAASFILTENYLYASIMLLLMFFFISTNDPETIKKKANKFRSLIFALATSTLPVAVYFSSKKPFVSENVKGTFISIILGLLVVFVAASSAIGAGINRTKGDKDTYE